MIDKKLILDLIPSDLKHREALVEFFIMTASKIPEIKTLEDYKEYIDLVTQSPESTFLVLDNDLEIGLKNGYSIEKQLKITKSEIDKLW